MKTPNDFKDARWAQHDPGIQFIYRGQFVVPYRGKILAHGINAKAVLKEAARLSGRKPEELPLVGLIDPLQDISY